MEKKCLARNEKRVSVVILIFVDNDSSLQLIHEFIFILLSLRLGVVDNDAEIDLGKNFDFVCLLCFPYDMDNIIIK